MWAMALVMLMGGVAKADWIAEMERSREKSRRSFDAMMQTSAMQDQARAAHAQALAAQDQAHQLRMLRLEQSSNCVSAENQAIKDTLKYSREKLREQAVELVSIKGLSEEQKEEIAKILGFKLYDD